MVADTLQVSDFCYGDACVRCCHRRPASSCQRCWTLQGGDEPQMADTDDIGLDIWPANAVLCEYMAGHAPLVRNAASILELGSGIGVAGLLTLALGAQSIVLTDYDSQVATLPLPSRPPYFERSFRHAAVKLHSTRLSALLKVHVCAWTGAGTAPA